MVKKYFIWKNPECNGINPEYVEVSGKKYYEIIKADERKRYFKQIDEGVEFGMEVYVMETTYSDYLEWHKEQERKRRKKKEQEEYQPKFVCLNDFVGDSELTYEEVIADENVNVEDDAIKNLELQVLRECIANLTEKEQEIIRLIRISLEEDLSERDLCNLAGMKRTTFRSRKDKIFKKIEKSFVQNIKKRAIQG